MNRSNVIAMVVLGLVLVGSTAQVQGDTKYFCADTDNTWRANSGQNWRTFGGGQDCDDGTRVDAPTASDRAVIVSGKTCNIASNAVADSLDVESDATLNIQGATGNSLTLDDDGANGTTITGTLNLLGANSLLAFTTNDQTIDGAGKIVGQHNAAQITIEVLKTLTSETIIEGNLQITGAGIFRNHGTVHANVAGTLLLDCNSFDDDSTALWKISSSSSAILQIDVTSTTAPDLDGAFEILNGGTLDVDSEGLQTTGSLLFRNGWINVAAGSSVTFSE